MSEAPERLVLELRQGMTFDAWTECRDPRYAKSGPVEYVRADRIEELEAKMAKAVEALKMADQAIMENTTDQDLLMWGEQTVSHIRTTLAELTGGKDE